MRNWNQTWQKPDWRWESWEKVCHERGKLLEVVE
jgi:hypothetical protein